jgi:hypothetical protein
MVQPCTTLKRLLNNCSESYMVFNDLWLMLREHSKPMVIPGVKKSLPPYLFFINGDKIIIFRD